MATYYVRGDGDNGNDGSANDSSHAWATLSYACTQASSGDRLYVGSSLTDTGICTVPINVDIDGAGEDTVTVTFTTTDGDGFLQLLPTDADSTNDPEAHNAFIRNITFDGSAETAYFAIVIQNRDEVDIYDATFQDIKNSAIHIEGVSGLGHTVVPSYWAEGIDIYGCTFTNCSCNDTRSPYSLYYGCVNLEAVKGITIHDNTFTHNEADNGQGIAMCTLGWIDSCLIYSNIFHGRTDERHNAFSIELRHLRNDCKIYDNTINGNVSFISGGEDALVGSSDWHLQIYGNTFDTTHWASGEEFYTIELTHKRVRVYQNHFECDPTYDYGAVLAYYPNGAECPGTKNIERIQIDQNTVFDPNYIGFYIRDTGSEAGDGDIQYIDIWNNVVQGAGSYGVMIENNDANNDITNLTIKNNIFLDNYRPVWLGGIDHTGIQSPVITYNFFEDNSNGDAVLDAGATTPTIENNKTLAIDGAAQLNETGDKPDPFYRASSAESNCVDAGIDVGLPYVGSAPDMGRYETGIISLEPSVFEGKTIIEYKKMLMPIDVKLY